MIESKLKLLLDYIIICEAVSLFGEQTLSVVYQRASLLVYQAVPLIYEYEN